MAARKYGQSDEPVVQARNDVYTGLLALSLFGLLGSCLLLFLDWYGYGSTPPAKYDLPALPGVKAPGAPAAPKQPLSRRSSQRTQRAWSSTELHALCVCRDRISRGARLFQKHRNEICRLALYWP